MKTHCVNLEKAQRMQSRCARAHGFSLVEFMIAITLGLLLSGAAISAFVSINGVRTSTSGNAGVADAGRYALDGLGQALRSAGYLACVQSAKARVDLSTTLDPLLIDLAEPVSGYEYSATAPGATYTFATPVSPASAVSQWVSSAALGDQLDAAVFNAKVSGATTTGRPIAGSDVIAVHETPVGTAPVYLSANAPSSSTQLTTTLGVSPGNTGFASVLASGTAVAVVANCQAAEVTAISAMNGSVLTLSPSNAVASLSASYDAGAHLGLVDTLVYYVGVGSDGEGALFVLDSGSLTVFGAPVELVPDVENMQILYGVDTTGNQTVGEYVTADQVPTDGVTGDFNSVIDVKIALLVAAPPGSAAKPSSALTFQLLGTNITVPVDTRLRRVFTNTYALRSGAG